MPNGSLVKSIAGTSLGGTANANVAVGEVITYALAVTLPEGTSTPVVLTDVLPAGVVFVAGSVVVDVTGFGGTVTGTATASVVGTTLTITLTGPVVVTGDNVTNNNTFVVRYQTRVLDVVGNVGFSPGQTTLTNSASLQAGTAPVVPGNGVTATVVEPQLTVVMDVTSADTSVDAGTSLTYRVVISHTGASQAPAYNVALADALAAVGLTLDTPRRRHCGRQHPAHRPGRHDGRVERVHGLGAKPRVQRVAARRHDHGHVQGHPDGDPRAGQHGAEHGHGELRDRPDQRPGRAASRRPRRHHRQRQQPGRRSTRTSTTTGSATAPRR